MKTIHFQLILLLFFLPNLNFAQQKNLWTSFTTADGLPDNTILAVLESSDGKLWLGTTNGVSWYQDGIWTNLTAADGLAHDLVSAIIESSTGAVWFGTSGGGVSRYYQSTWKTFTANDGLADNEVLCIYESSDGTLWFGTNGGLSRYHNAVWTTFTTSDGLPSNYIRTIIEASDGKMWFGTSGGGVCSYQQGVWKTYTTTHGLANQYVLAMIQASDGSLWFGTQNGASQYQNGIWKSYHASDGLAGNYITAILQSSEGILWFGTSDGVSSYHNGNWKSLTSNDGLVHNFVRSMSESSDGALWFGTNGGGISRYEQEIWSNIVSGANFDLSYVEEILKASDGTMWFATWGKGVSRSYQGIWETFTTANGLPSNYVHTVSLSSDGAVWCGTISGACRYSNGSWTTPLPMHQFEFKNVHAIIEAADSTIWFGTVNGLYSYRNGQFTRFDTTSGLINNDVRAIIETSDGAFWFGTIKGVSRYQQGSWTSFTTEDGLAHNSIQAIVESSDGALWFGTYGGGISRLLGKNWISYDTYSTNRKLLSNKIAAILKSSNGSLWFGTYEGGVCQFRDGIWTTYNSADGLLDNDVTAIYEDTNGTMWFGTFEGGVSLLKPDKSPPFTYIIGDPPNLSGSSINAFNFSGKDFRVRSENILFSYALLQQLSYTPPNPDQYSWSPFTFNTEVQSKPLGNGDYSFYVRARDTWGNVDPTPASWRFKVDVTAPTVTINFPKPEDTIAGDVAIIGSAYDNSPIKDFARYELRYAFTTEIDNATTWQANRFLCQNNNVEIRDDTLAIWNTSGLQNGTYWLHLSAKDGLDHESHDFVKVQIVKASHAIDSRQGGNFGTASGNIQIYLPPNALPKDKQIHIKDLSVTQLIPVDNPEIAGIDFCFEVLPTDIHLLKPGVMTLTYSDSLIVNKNEKKIAIYQTNDEGKNWQRLGGSTDLEKKKITTTFEQFGTFALYEDLTEGGKAGILSANSQPRIFSPRGGGYDTQTAISFELGKETSVTIKIYNPAGRLIRVLTENEPMSHGNNVVAWDGRDQQGEFCVSGLYIVTIQAEEKMATKTIVVLNKF